MSEAIVLPVLTCSIGWSLLLVDDNWPIVTPLVSQMINCTSRESALPRQTLDIVDTCMGVHPDLCFEFIIFTPD